MKKVITRMLVLMMMLMAVMIAGTAAVSAEDETTAQVLKWGGFIPLFEGWDETTAKITKVELGNDITVDNDVRVVLPSGRSMILDLNGHSINGMGKMISDFTIHGDLTIINSKDGMAGISNFANYAIWIAEDGKVTINDGVKISNNTGCAAVYTQGSFVMNGGEITGNSVIDDDEHEVGAAVVVDKAGSLTLKGNHKLANNTVTHKNGGMYFCDVILLNAASRIRIPEELRSNGAIGVAARQDMIFTEGWPANSGGKDPSDSFQTVKMNTSIATDEASGELKYTIQKTAGTLKVSAKTYTAKYKTLKKKSVTIKRSKVLTVSGKIGTLTYTRAKGNKKITVNKKNGNITLKKGLKKGKYKVTIAVKDTGDFEHNAKTVKKTVTIKVK